MTGTLLQDEWRASTLVEIAGVQHVAGAFIAIGERGQTQFVFGEAQHGRELELGVVDIALLRVRL